MEDFVKNAKKSKNRKNHEKTAQKTRRGAKIKKIRPKTTEQPKKRSANRIKKAKISEKHRKYNFSEKGHKKRLKTTEHRMIPLEISKSSIFICKKTQSKVFRLKKNTYQPLLNV